MFVDNPAPFMADFSVVSQGGTCTLNGAAFDVIFDSSSADVLGDFGGRDPIATCPESTLAGADPRGKTLIINGVSYVVRENKPDGNGWTVLELAKP